ncbi:MAG TPA: sulfite exporter TauE/SafE family protein, partial [Polyangiaceae bacterium]|nr:sulfite exporter TauE/SafE family protein [Polyangiaceae bacterium]
LLFKVQPLAAVSSDIVASMIMKPIGGGVHWRRGTVNTELVRWLVVGSVPSAFLGVLVLKNSGQGEALQHLVKVALGIALLVVASGLIIRPLLSRGRQAGDSVAPLVVKKLPTVLIGITGGLVVGLTSVGSGSLMIILLLMLYPKLRLSELVGTDLVQAIPLVASAALGHALFGDFQLALTASILIGSVPGVFIGAQLSSRAPDALIRPALILVLLGSSLKLLGSSNGVLALVIALFAAAYLAVRASEQRSARLSLKLR